MNFDSFRIRKHRNIRATGLVFSMLGIGAILGVHGVAYGQSRDPVFDTILQRVKLDYNKRVSPIVVVEVEQVLFDATPRVVAILKEYGATELQKLRPKEAVKLKEVQERDILYRLPDTIRALGVKDDALVNNGVVFWSERYFTDAYLKHDRPVVGAADYVRQLYSTGARIIYYSKRDVGRQLVGTVKALRDAGYPIGIQGAELVMKPTMKTPNALFRQQVTHYLRLTGQVVAFIGGHSEDLNVFRRAFADSQCVLYGQADNPKAPPLLSGVSRALYF